jgi:hypothetical protein
VWLCLHAGEARADKTETAGDVIGIALPAAAFALTFTHDDPDGRVQLYKSFGSTIASTWLLKGDHS